VSRRLQQLAARREALCSRSEQLRAELSGEVSALAGRWRIADRLVAIGRSGTSRLVIAAAVILVLFGRPRRVLHLGLQLLALWPVASRLLPHLKRLFTERGAASA
jgi:hypothetical protein